MAIEVYGYTQEAGSWKQRTNGTHQGNNRNAADHAERRVLTFLKRRDGPYLIVQNAFPCENCHTYFLAESRTSSFIIKVTANEGSYSRDHKLGDHPSLPRILYYHGGALKMVGIGSRGAAAEPPDGFPPGVADFASIG